MMPNSKIQGTVVFFHPTASPALLEKVLQIIDTTAEYGYFEGVEIEDYENTANWNTEYEFTTRCKRTFRSTIESYTRHFYNENVSFKKELNGLVMNVRSYMEYNHNTQVFEKGSIKIQFVYDPLLNNLTTDTLDVQTQSIVKNTKNALLYKLSDIVWDTFTIKGCENLYSILQNVRKSTLIHGPLSDGYSIHKLIDNLDYLSPADLKNVFEDMFVQKDWFDNDDIGQISELFDDKQLFTHRLISKYAPNSI